MITITGTKEYEQTDIFSCFLIFIIPRNISKALCDFHNIEINKFISVTP